MPAAVRRDLLALALAAVSALGFVSLYARHDSAPERQLAAALHALVGRIAPAAPALVAIAALILVFAWREHTLPSRGAGAALGVLTAAGFAHLPIPHAYAFARAWQGDGGGLLGASIDWLLRAALGSAGERVALYTLAAAALLLVGQFSIRAAVVWPFRHGARGVTGAGRAIYQFVTEPVPDAPAARRRRPPAEVAAPAAPAGLLPAGPPMESAPDDVLYAEAPQAAESGAPAPGPTPAPARRRKGAGSSSAVPAWDEGSEEGLSADATDAAAALEPTPPALEPGDMAPAAPASAPALPARPVPISPDLFFQAPPLELLRKGHRSRSLRGAAAVQRASVVEEALKSFGIAARVVDVVQGPAVTRFEVQPGPGVKVSRISALADDLALALAAVDVRIVAPIPGKAALGIEVPNAEQTPVYLRDVLESGEFRSSRSPLTVCLGQDIAGRPVVATLERLLHVLVAGATGSGKSITLNSMLVSLLYKSRPDEVKLVLIDPKMVELVVYNGTPHLLAPVVTDPRKAAATLRTVVKEMERRYQLFTEAGARDLTRYNTIAAEAGTPPLPYVVVVIDELADLMLVARADVEDAIQRLTQMARAAGIHLIVATQRPSVDVITGVIKANIPTRIALAVSSQIDSRTILDHAGAEKLVGRGDMLFRPVGAQKSIRAQGAFIGDTEVEAVLTFLRKAAKPEYDTAIMEADAEEEGGPGNHHDDELFVEALQIVVESGQASVSNLQRRLRVGFTRAGRLVDMMEQRGYVGPHQGSKSREVLLSADQFHRLFGDRPSA